jgi:phospholipase/carboxylesterase
MNITRRNFCTLAASTIASLTVGSGCRQIGGSVIGGGDGRLTARPDPSGPGFRGAIPVSGRIELGLNQERDAILSIPKTTSQTNLPLLVMLHGATQSADDMFWYLGSTHEEAGVVVLAPNARDTTWDAIGGSFGLDVEFINRALSQTFDMVAIDPTRIAVGGFSDGASYALGLGLTNGDLFSRVVAFSPGFIVDNQPNGKPRLFISHGTHDHILPIDSCGRRVAAELKGRGYEVTFREFEGDHEIPAAIAGEGLKFVAGR